MSAQSAISHVFDNCRWHSSQQEFLETQSFFHHYSIRETMGNRNRVWFDCRQKC